MGNVILLPWALPVTDKYIYRRDIVKVGIVYIKDGQDEQSDILKNDSASDLYNEFVSGLGWASPIATHKGKFQRNFNKNGKKLNKIRFFILKFCKLQSKCY